MKSKELSPLANMKSKKLSSLAKNLLKESSPLNTGPVYSNPEPSNIAEAL